MAIGKEIGQLISNRGITLKAFSKEAGISYNTLYAIVKRDNETVKPEILKKIAIALNLPYEQFLQSISDNMFSQMIQRLDSLHEESPDFQTLTDADVHLVLSLSNAQSSIRNELKKERYLWAITELSHLLSKLNPIGMTEAVKRVEELTQIIPYTDPCDYSEPPTTE